MKKLAIIVAFGICGISYATDTKVTLFGSCLFTASGKDAQLSKFETSYNDYQKTELSNTFQNRGLGFGWQVGATYWYTPSLGFTIRTDFQRSARQAVFNTGERRVMEYQTQFPFLGGITLGKSKLKTSFLFGVGQNSIASYLLYADGTKDYNSTLPLNGVYSGFGFAYGLDLCYLPHPKIGFFASLTGISGSEYSDKAYLRGIDNKAGFDSRYLPTDYNVYLTELQQGNGSNLPNSIIAKLRYTGITVGIRFNLNI